MQQLVRDLLDGGCHRIAGVDGTDDDRPVPAALVVLYSCRLVVRNDREILPDLAFKAVLGEFLAQDGIALAECLQTVSRDGAGAPDSQARARERLAEDHAVREPQFLSDYADLVLIEQLDRFYELELEVFRKTAHVVVGFDRTGFYDIRVYGSLGKEADALQLACFLFEYADEFGTDDLALLLRIGYAGQFVKETVRGIHVHKVCLELIAENTYDLLGFTLAEESVIDVDGNQLFSHGLDEQSRDNR